MTEIQKQGRTRAEIETSALEYAKQAKQAAKKAVELAWHAGAEFNVLKERMPHGEWQSWLVKHRIPPSTARAWMQIARELPLKEAMKLGTVRASRTLPWRSPRRRSRSCAPCMGQR